MSFDLPQLPDNWDYRPLGECVLNGSISYGVVQPGQALEVGVPMVRVNNFFDGDIDLTQLMKISPEVEKAYTRTRLKGGEVLLTLVGSVGQVAIAPETLSGFNVARAISVIHPISDIGPDWIAICLRSPLSQYLLNSRANTTVQTTINLKDLKALPIPLPPKNIRNNITSTISALDLRVKLLRETNATLEAIAQALFKSWFVDFDPVHAKQQGRAPEGMDESTAALFPDSFEESEVGVVPKGWRVGSIGNLASVRGGFAYKSSDFSDEGLPVLKIKNIVGDGTVDANDVQRISSAMAEKTTRFGLKDGDVLMAMTGATIGKVGIVVTLNNEVPYLNQRVAKFEEGKETGNNSWLIFTAFQNAFMSDQIVNAASGSAQPNISTTGIESATLIVPNNIMVLKAFDSIVAPLFLLWVNNQKQGKTLAALRDTLLPRLISGQLRIAEAEDAAEEATA